MHYTYLGRGDLDIIVLAHPQPYDSSDKKARFYLGRDERRERSACDEAHGDCDDGAPTKIDCSV